VANGLRTDGGARKSTAATAANETTAAANETEREARFAIRL
jgi:hypothetical protein